MPAARRRRARAARRRRPVGARGRCWRPTRASSPTAGATAATSSWRRRSSCCSTTSTTRGRTPRRCTASPITSTPSSGATASAPWRRWRRCSTATTRSTRIGKAYESVDGVRPAASSTRGSPRPSTRCSCAGRRAVTRAAALPRVPTARRTSTRSRWPTATRWPTCCRARRALQVVERAEVEVDPAPDERAEHIDVFGNRVLQIGIHRAHDALTLLGAQRGRRRAGPAAVGAASRGRSWRCASAELRGGDALAVRPFAGSSPYVPPRPPRRGPAGARRGGVHAAPAGRRRGPGPVPPDPRDVRVRPVVHGRVDAAVGRARRPARRVPGLRPPRRPGACARSGSPRATSAGTSRPIRRAGRRGCAAPTRRTPGARCGCRSRGGSTSTRRTTASRRTATSRWPGAATTATWPRSAASSSVRPPSRSCPSRSTSSACPLRAVATRVLGATVSNGDRARSPRTRTERVQTAGASAGCDLRRTGGPDARTVVAPSNMSGVRLAPRLEAVRGRHGGDRARSSSTSACSCRCCRRFIEDELGAGELGVGLSVVDVRVRRDLRPAADRPARRRATAAGA